MKRLGALAPPRKSTGRSCFPAGSEIIPKKASLSPEMARYEGPHHTVPKR